MKSCIISLNIEQLQSFFVNVLIGIVAISFKQLGIKYGNGLKRDNIKKMLKSR